MMPVEGWNEVPLASLCEEIFDGPHATPRKTSRGPVFLGIWNLKEGRLDLSTTEHLSEEDYVKWTRRVTPQPGDIVFSYETRLGQAAIIPNDLRCCLGRRMGLLRPDLRNVDARFLLFAFLGPWFQSTVRQMSIVGSTVDRILLTELGKYPIRVPGLEEQRAIAGLLGALDDKIEANQRISQTLDRMAQAVFRSWFVDFEPVVSRVGGNEPYRLARGDVPLFPRSFVNSDLGPIPTGWKIDSIDDQLELGREGIVPGQHPEEVFAHYSIPAFDDGKTARLEPGAAIKSNKYAVPEDAVLLSKLNPEIIRVWLPDSDVSHRAVCSTEFLVCKAREPASREYLYCLFMDSEFRSEFAGRVTGTSKSHQRVRPDDLVSMRIVVPGAEVVRLFTRRVRPWFLRAESARRESLLLISLRGSLLPRLLSGSLRVSRAEKLLEQAV